MRVERAYQNSIEKKMLRKANLDGVALVVGSRVYGNKLDRRTLYPDAVGVDMIGGPGVDYYADLTWEVPCIERATHIDCVSVLEHCQEPWNLVSTLGIYRRDTTIFFTVPFVWREHAYPNDYFRFTKEGIVLMCKQNGIEIEDICYVSAGKKVKKPPVITHDGWPYMAKTEVYAFGRVV